MSSSGPRAARRTSAPEGRRRSDPVRATLVRAASRSPSSRGLRGGAASPPSPAPTARRAAAARAGRPRGRPSVPGYGRPHSPPLHVLRERGHRQLLRDLGLADERAGPAATDEITVANELVERGPDGQARDAEVGGELTLGGNRLADPELFDQLEEAIAGIALLRHGAAGASSLGSGSAAGRSLAASKLTPLSTSKKWKRAGSTARVSGCPTAASTRGSIRALKSVSSCASSVPSSLSVSPAPTAIRFASTGKNTWASDPSSSTTAGTTSIVGDPAGAEAAASKASGRIPSVTLRWPRAG